MVPSTERIELVPDSCHTLTPGLARLCRNGLIHSSRASGNPDQVEVDFAGHPGVED